MSGHIVSIRTNVVVFIVLLLLLLATVGAAFLPLADWHLPVALGFAAIKAILIGLFFMHVFYRHKLTWVVSLASLVWLGILIALTLGDYLARGWLPNIPGK